jgi:hypothetical protein
VDVSEMQPITIAYYATPHGFGHAVRAIEVIRHLFLADPSIRVILVSDFPDYLVEECLGRPIPFRRRRLDVGLVQKDSLRFDLDATLLELMKLRRDSEALVREEMRFFQTQGVHAIVSDVSYIPFAAASEYGIPSIGIGNFTWNWIYEAYTGIDSRWRPVIEWIRECYGKSDLFLQLPMHGDVSVCPKVEPVPLIARKAARDRETVRKILGCGPETRAYMIYFVALDLSAEALRRIGAFEKGIFFYKRPLSLGLANGRSLDDFGISFVEAVAAMDGIITKPGYGIVSDCLVHGVPMIYTDRGLFPEVEILVETMNRHLATVHLPSEEFASGRWGAAIERLETLSRPPDGVRSDGASVCAQRIIDVVRAKQTTQLRGLS